MFNQVFNHFLVKLETGWKITKYTPSLTLLLTKGLWATFWIFLDKKYFSTNPRKLNIHHHDWDCFNLEVFQNVIPNCKTFLAKKFFQSSNAESFYWKTTQYTPSRLQFLLSKGILKYFTKFWDFSGQEISSYPIQKVVTEKLHNIHYHG